MKTKLISVLAAGLWLLGLSASAIQFPISSGILQSDLNANKQNLTNVLTIVFLNGNVLTVNTNTGLLTLNGAAIVGGGTGASGTGGWSQTNGAIWSIKATGEYAMTNPLTGAYGIWGTNGHMRTVDQFGSVREWTTNSFHADVMSGGVKQTLLWSNGVFTLNGVSVPTATGTIAKATQVGDLWALGTGQGVVITNTSSSPDWILHDNGAGFEITEPDAAIYFRLNEGDGSAHAEGLYADGGDNLFDNGFHGWAAWLTNDDEGFLGGPGNNGTNVLTSKWDVAIIANAYVTAATAYIDATFQSSSKLMGMNYLGQESTLVQATATTWTNWDFPAFSISYSSGNYYLLTNATTILGPGAIPGSGWSAFGGYGGSTVISLWFGGTNNLAGWYSPGPVHVGSGSFGALTVAGAPVVTTASGTAPSATNATYAASAGTLTFTNAQTLWVDNAGTVNGIRGNLTLPFALLSQAISNSSPGDTIIINAGTYFEASQTAIWISNNLTIRALDGASYSVSNCVGGNSVCFQMASGDAIYGGTWIGVYCPGQAGNSCIFGDTADPMPTNCILQNANIVAPFAGVRFSGVSTPGNMVVKDCLFNDGYSGILAVSSGGGFTFQVWNSEVDLTNPPPSPLLTDVRNGFKLKGAESGVMEIHNCKIVLNDASTNVGKAYGITTQTGGSSNQFRIFGLTIDSTGCTNPLSFDVAINAPTNSNLFAGVYRADGLPLTFTNLSGDVNKPWRNPPLESSNYVGTFTGNGSGLNYPSNTWSLTVATNGLSPGDFRFVNSNGFPVVVAGTNGAPYYIINYLSPPGGGVIP